MAPSFFFQISFFPLQSLNEKTLIYAFISNLNFNENQYQKMDTHLSDKRHVSTAEIAGKYEDRNFIATIAPTRWSRLH